jgi:fructose/tagatose bisphosphate aldolase
MVTGAVALAEFGHVVAQRYPVTVALHTDDCPKDKLDTYVRTLPANLPAASRGRSGSAVQLPHVGRLSHPG